MRSWLLLVTVLVGVVSAQKLFFKSNKLLQQEVVEHLQVTDQMFINIQSYLLG